MKTVKDYEALAAKVDGWQPPEKENPAGRTGDSTGGYVENSNRTSGEQVAQGPDNAPARDLNTYPDRGDRPCFRVYSEWAERDDRRWPPGVYYHSLMGEGDDAKLSDVWICDPLHIRAQTRDTASNAWGRWLEWRDQDGKAHHLAMPMAALEGDGSEVRRELAHQGLRIAPGRRACELLENYLKSAIVKDRARCVERLGWHGNVYVTPSETIGQTDDVVVFQNPGGAVPALSTAGTAQQWRDGVARLAEGNSRLAFAIALAFAAPLAELAGEDSGGFHLRGSSSTGKSTILRAAASVFNNPTEGVKTWRGTTNGIEGVAALHNDGLLILDELSQIDGKEAGQVAYMLANSTGKARASRTGGARQPARWRLLFLSAGEVSLAGLMSADGRRVNAGQEVRLADIPADAGAGMGAFEELHGHTTSAAQAQAIKDAANQHYGAVGIEFLRRIVADRESLPAKLTASIRRFVADTVPAGAAGQVIRVAQRFALVAAAGELATEYGLTGWPTGESERAAKTCFKAWLEGFGGTSNREERQLFAQVRAFFEAHGSSRFENWDATESQRIINRAGFYKSMDMDSSRQYYVLPQAFKNEIVKGFEHKWAAKTLLTAGWLEGGEGGRATRLVRLPGIGPTRCYVFTGRMWADDSTDSLADNPKSAVTAVTAVTANTGAASSVTAQKTTAVTAVTEAASVTAVTADENEPVTRKPSIGAGVTAVTAVTAQKSNVRNDASQSAPPSTDKPGPPPSEDDLFGSLLPGEDAEVL